MIYVYMRKLGVKNRIRSASYLRSYICGTASQSISRSRAYSTHSHRGIILSTSAGGRMWQEWLTEKIAQYPRRVPLPFPPPLPHLPTAPPCPPHVHPHTQGPAFATGDISLRGSCPRSHRLRDVAAVMGDPGHRLERFVRSIRAHRPRGPKEHDAGR